MNLNQLFNQKISKEENYNQIIRKAITSNQDFTVCVPKFRKYQVVTSIFVFMFLIVIFQKIDINQSFSKTPSTKSRVSIASYQYQSDRLNIYSKESCFSKNHLLPTNRIIIK